MSRARVPKREDSELPVKIEKKGYKVLMSQVLLSFFVDVESVNFVGFGESSFDECFDFVEVVGGFDGVFFFMVC